MMSTCFSGETWECIMLTHSAGSDKRVMFFEIYEKRYDELLILFR